MKKLGIIFGIIIGLIVFGAFKKKGEDNSKPKISATEFVAELEKLGYYKYADKKNIDSLKNDLIENYDPTNELVSIWDDNTGVPLDYRYYWCDGETVYEEGGFTELLEQVKPTFDKIGLKINVTDHFEEWDDKNKWLNHRITINRTEYVIFKNFKDYGWGEAVMRFAQIINQEAENQGIKEKVYLASGGNDGRLIFLTKELYDYIYSVYTNEQWKPLEVNEWMKVMSVKPMKLN
ncbi:hypothetical protein [uncultured Algibacter sp.]|uniref:hypothetical protein n=1 Tax=uncultured Algibacter sp. TaxID=298659 RepID=UPI0026312D9B|nr:hypothetical protein [uncultured Algibacter sp.]